ncbi:MAG: hypothetical protein ABSC94_04720 [Polyangiaceae bacterium]
MSRWIKLLPVLALVAMACVTTQSPRNAQRADAGARRLVQSSELAWSYEVHIGAEPTYELEVEGRFAPAPADVVVVDAQAAPFVRGVEYADGSAWRPAPQRDASWIMPCHAAGCRIRYRFALGAACARIDDGDTAFSAGDLLVAPPSTWLLRPDREPDRPSHFRFHVTEDAGVRFATGIHRARLPSASPSDETFETSTDNMASASFAAIGPFHIDTVQSGTSLVAVAVAPHRMPLAESETLVWVERAVQGLAAYFGRFPAPRTLVIVTPGGHAVTRGETLGDGGPAVVVRVAEGLTPQGARDDWVLTHELVHVALPSLGREHAWLEEGIATYVEPIVRARSGLVSPEKFWRDLIEGLPQGLPEPGDQGLERTRTWARTYWGGALFCFVADVRIRERTHETQSFDDVLRGIAATGEDVEDHWGIDQFLAVGDAATGTGVLRELYREFALAPGSVDLGSFWRRLGVALDGGRVLFDDAAPMSPLRRAITARTQ